MEKMIKIYHGSEKVIEQPILGEGKRITTLVLVFIALKVKRRQKNGPYHLCEMVFQAAIHWTRNI